MRTRITLDNGHGYDLSVEVIKALREATTADHAETVFATQAPHILKQDRLEIWVAAPLN